MPGGSPTKYKPEYCEQLVEFMGAENCPMPYEAFAGEIGVDRDTLYEWEKVHKEFSDAKKRGRAAQYKELMKLGFNGMQGKVIASHETVGGQINNVDKDENGKPKLLKGFTRRQQINGFNPTTWIFMMKNMQGWRDRLEISEDDEIDELTFNGEPADGT